MLSLTLDTAKTIGIVAVSVLIALAIASAWIMKSAAQKVAMAVILVLLAALAWTQRAALDDCADRVSDTVGSSATIDTTCSFFGQDVTVSAQRDG